MFLLWHGLVCGAEVHKVMYQIKQLWKLPALVGCHQSKEPGCAGTHKHLNWGVVSVVKSAQILVW